MGFDIDVKTKLKQVDFVNVTHIYKKKLIKQIENLKDKPVYIHTSSNHLLAIINQIPQSTSLSVNNFNETSFNSTKNDYDTPPEQIVDFRQQSCTYRKF